MKAKQPTKPATETPERRVITLSAHQLLKQVEREITRAEATLRDARAIVTLMRERTS